MTISLIVFGEYSDPSNLRTSLTNLDIEYAKSDLEKVCNISKFASTIDRSTPGNPILLFLHSLYKFTAHFNLS